MSLAGNVSSFATRVGTEIKALWTAVNGKVSASTVDAAGDLLVGSADNTVGRLALGANGQVLTVDTSGSGVGKVKWATPTGGGSGTDIDPLFLAGV